MPYPALTTWRMPLDMDGTVFTYVLADQLVREFTPTEVGILQNETTDVWQGPVGEYDIYVTAIFPELRDVDAVFVSHQWGGGTWTVTSIESSANTTNGQDGTWSLMQSSYASPNGVSPGWRTDLLAETVLNVKAVRLRLDGSAPYAFPLAAFHIWGEISAGQDLERLVFWDAAADSKMPPTVLDWGDVPRGSSADKTVRVKNMSGTHTANSITAAFSILTDGSPSVPAQHTLSYGGSAFAAQVNLGSLAPGAVSGVLTVRRITPTDAQLGLFAPRLSATAASWT